MIKLDSRESFLRSIYFEFSKLGCCPDVALFIACQFALESDFGKSRLASRDNNFCGMKSPVLRPSLNLNRARTFASYMDDVDCVHDYMLWLAYSRCTVSRLQELPLFILHLKEKKYCSDPDYIPSIDRLFKQFSYLLNQFSNE